MNLLPILDKIARLMPRATFLDLDESRQLLVQWRSSHRPTCEPLLLPYPLTVFCFRLAGFVGRPEIESFDWLGWTPTQCALVCTQRVAADPVFCDPCFLFQEPLGEMRRAEVTAILNSAADITLTNESDYRGIVLRCLEPAVTALSMLNSGAATLVNIPLTVSRKMRRLRKLTGHANSYVALRSTKSPKPSQAALKRRSAVG